MYILLLKKSIENQIENNEQKMSIEEEPKKVENTNNNEEQNNIAGLPIELIELLRNQNQRQINSQFLRQFIYNRNYNNTDKSRDEYNCIMQWEFLLEILICFLKDDSCPFWNLMAIYTEAVSSQTKRDLFNVVRNN